MSGKELKALRQLFNQAREDKLQAEEQARIDEIRMDSVPSCGIAPFQSRSSSPQDNEEVYVCDRAACGYRFSDTSGLGRRYLWPIGFGLPLTIFSVALFFGAFWPPSLDFGYLLLANIPVWLCALGLRSLSKLGSAVCPSCHRGEVLCSVHGGNRGKTALAVSLQRYPGSG